MPAKEQAHWSNADIKVHIEYLALQLSTVADGTGFKNMVWNEGAVKVNELTRMKGCNKTGSSCKNKWARLKETYNIIVKIKAQSGFKWDDEKGADIDETTAEMWAAFEKVHDFLKKHI
ncbi:hypothetical protein BYT27DRAFT_7101946 [Phlegmacium glaucopus]|nr:hypothetical protein BYT27DRAFT_7101946 [Phlegmacium glaucopus]